MHLLHLQHITRHLHYIWIARQNYRPRPLVMGGLQLLSIPWLPCVFSSPCSYVFRLCRWTLCGTQSCVTTGKLSPPGSSISATNQGLVQELVLAGFFFFLVWRWNWSCLWSWALCFLTSLCGILGVEQIMWVFYLTGYILSHARINW